jgi:hypothetical protein
MPSTAQVAQLSKFYVSGTPGTAITITAITKAAAAVVTAVNTLVVGDVVIFGAVTGMPEINGLLGIVTVASGASFTVAIDSSGFATAGTTGTASPQTFSKVGNVQDFTPDGGSATVIDVTNMDSTAKEKRQGLQDNGNYSLTYDSDDTDVGQLRLIAARAAQAVVVFKQYYPGGLKIRAWQGFVQKVTEPAAGVDKVLRTSATIVVTGSIFRG